MGRANGALEREKIAANIQGKGKSAHPQKVQKEEDPEGYKRRPEKQIDPQRERQEKEAGGKKGQRSNIERESRQGQVYETRTITIVRANAPAQVSHEAFEKREREGPGPPSAGAKGKKWPFGDKAQEQRKEGMWDNRVSEVLEVSRRKLEEEKEREIRGMKVKNLKKDPNEEPRGENQKNEGRR